MPAKARRAETTTDGEQRMNILFVVAAILVVGLFYGAYSIGTRKQQRLGQGSIVDLQRRAAYLRQRVENCTDRSGRGESESEKLHGEVADQWNANRLLEEHNDRLVEANAVLEKQNIECAEAMEMSKQQWAQEDAKYAVKLNGLDRTNRALRAKAKRLSDTQGMRTILLLAVTKKLALENQRLRVANNLPPEKSAGYMEELIEKWRKLDSAGMQAGRGELLPPNRTEMWTDVRKRPSLLLSYDPDKHAQDIFLPKKSAETGEWMLPGWNGRHGTQSVRHGTFINSRLCPVTNINRQMRVLYEYALCAVGNNITQFMYPSAFKRCKDCHTEYLHNYLETPLVLFCDDCMPMHNTNEFKLLCQGLSSEDQYGSTLFWRTRSRLRFKGRYLDLADEWMASHGFKTAQRTLAVRIPRAEQKALCDKMRNNQRPILSFTRLLQGRPGVKEFSTNFDDQCFPAIDLMAEKINERVAEIGGSQRVKVFLSTDMEAAGLRQLRKAVKAPIVFRHSTGRPTEDDIVDTYIAASCSDAILSRFDVKSAHINEAHMLLRKLEIAGVSVW